MALGSVGPVYGLILDWPFKGSDTDFGGVSRCVFDCCSDSLHLAEAIATETELKATRKYYELHVAEDWKRMNAQFLQVCCMPLVSMLLTVEMREGNL